MPTITIRDVPQDVYDELVARAARRGQAFQQFMLAECKRIADRPPADDVLARARERAADSGRVLSRAAILDDLHADRR